MREGYGNLWDLVQPTEAIVITTNGTIAFNGRGVMGRGIALEAKRRIKGIERILGDHLATHGNHAWYLARGSDKYPGPQFGIIFMPVKHEWWQNADPDLIVQSAHELVKLADAEQRIFEPAAHIEWENIWMPRPGCGNGHLDWDDVRPLIEPILDDRFIAVTFGGA